MPERNSHAAEELLEQYSAGSLPETEVARVEEHLLICETCQERLAFIDSWVRSLRRVNAQLDLAPRGFWERLAWPRWVPALAAALVLVVAVGFALKWNNRGAIAPIAVALEATRGETATQVPAGHSLLLQPGLEGLPQFSKYQLEIVDTLGKRVRQTTLVPGPGDAPGATVPGIGAGVYFIRLYSPARELLREYTLKVGNSGGR